LMMNYITSEGKQLEGTLRVLEGSMKP